MDEGSPERGGNVLGASTRVAGPPGVIRRLGLGVWPTIFLFLALVGCDQGTKQVAKQHLESAAPHVLVRSVLDLRYTENTDVGFNLLRAIPPETRRPLILVVASASVLLLLGSALWQLRKNAPGQARRSFLVWQLPLVLFAAGALGNLLDRGFRGYVIDFVHLAHWPVFNVADAYLTVAAVLLAWGTFFGKRHEPPAPTRLA